MTIDHPLAKAAWTSVPEVAVLIVCHNGRRFLRDCLSSVLASDDGEIVRHIVVVDNASRDGSADFLACVFPQVDVVRCTVNRGFAGGNNRGWEHIAKTYPKVDYIALLNQDTVVESGWLRPLIDYLESHPVAGAAQPKILLHPQTHLLNTVGNSSHFLGFGFTTGYLEPDDGRFGSVRAIDFPSGAAAVVRAAALRNVDLFDEQLFLYLEDAELGWKLRQRGYETVFIPSSVVYHKYAFQSAFRAYYYLERNRWWLLAVYYKTPTLLLLCPAALAMELGQWYFAMRHGLLRQKLRACGFFLNRRNLAALMRRRRVVQARRVIGDRRFLWSFAGAVTNPELRSPLLRRIANPIFEAYWQCARCLIAW